MRTSRAPGSLALVLASLALLVCPGTVAMAADAVPPGPAPDGMVWIPGGQFAMGTDQPQSRDARPWHQVVVKGFWMDRTPVTNEQFAAFAKATGYVTVAEKAPTKEEFPTAPPENLVAGSVVFTPPDHPVPLNDHFQWWSYVKGADWRHPAGPASDLAGKDKHPVVHVAYPDILAYCKWAGKRLPTEAEWEFAARGGADRKAFVWGDELKPAGRFMANTFQGEFPNHNTAEDGFAGTSPVGTFPANAFGLVDMAGNVWQWTSDLYRPDYYRQLAAAGALAVNPAGPVDSLDPAEPGVLKRVHRGGSYLSCPEYSPGYDPGLRGKGDEQTATNDLGFRCVKDR